MMDCIDVKSKFYAEFRRFVLKFSKVGTYKSFKALLQKLHRLENVPIHISYHDPKDGDLLPINNDDNYARAVSIAKPLLRIIIQKQGEVNDHNDVYKKNMISTIFGANGRLKSHPKISDPSDFRQVSAIIDVDVVPEFCRRVRLLKNSIADRPLGFFIKDGVSIRVTSTGFEKIPGIFISRVKPGGLAYISGLLSVNDEVLEVNGIEVAGKTLDQVRDMMVANSQNLIITVKPVNQRNKY